MWLEPGPQRSYWRAEGKLCQKLGLWRLDLDSSQTEGVELVHMLGRRSLRVPFSSGRCICSSSSLFLLPVDVLVSLLLCVQLPSKHTRG